MVFGSCARWWMVLTCSIHLGAVAGNIASRGDRAQQCDASRYHCCRPGGSAYCRGLDLVAICDPSASEDRRLAIEGSGCACPRGSAFDKGAGMCVAPYIPTDDETGICVTGNRQCQPCHRETDCGSTDWATCVKKGDKSFSVCKKELHELLAEEFV